MDGEEMLNVSVLEWMADTGYLLRLQQQCENYKQARRSGAVYKFVLDLDPCELLQHNALLGSVVLHSPRVAWRAFQQVCYTAICTMGWLPGLHTLSQVLLLLRLSSLPNLPGYTIGHASEFPPLTMEPRFYLFSGVVCGMSTAEKYTQSACFYCPMDGCAGGGEGIQNQYIRLHVAGATESTTIRNDFTCYHCGTTLVEDVAYRTLADKVLVNLVPLCALRMAKAVMLPHLQQRHQATTIILRDELCEGVRIGGECSVIGIPIPELLESSPHAQIATVVEANNVFIQSRRPQSERSLPHTMLEIYQACQYSPWAFSATLAYSFAAEIAPPGAYHRLKLSMLLSLVNTSQDMEGSRSLLLDLLAIGSDTPLLLQLLTYGSSFAQRSVLHSSTRDLCGSTRKEASGSFIDGGSLVLAEGGVCLVGNLSCHKTEMKDKLQHMLEAEQVSLTLPKRLGLEEAGQVSWPLRCTLWACSDHQRSKSFSKADEAVVRACSMHETSTISKALADRIGLVVVSDNATGDTDDHLTELLTQHILENAIGNETTPPLSQEDFREFLLVSSALPVTLSSAAQQLLRTFYLASRRVRVSSIYGTDMPISALNSMSSVAVAHARLSLRQQALEEDAIMAILLYEESLASRFGYSVLSLIPCPHFRDDNVGAYIGREFDEHMHQLHVQVLQFCKCHTPNPVGLQPEE